MTGCVGTCYLEPIVDVYDDDGEMTRYVKVQPDKVEEIVEEHLMQHQVAEDHAITEEDKEFVGKQQRVVLRNCGCDQSGKYRGIYRSRRIQGYREGADYHDSRKKLSKRSRSPD